MNLSEHTMDVTERKEKIISDTTRDLIVVVNYVFLCTIISGLGIAGNIVNILVFTRQGLKNNTMNISFLGLAISDLSSLVTLLFFNILMNPLFINSGTVLYSKDVQYLAAGWPHACCSRITGWITVYITAERCLCITIPLKVKQIITPRKTVITLCLIYILNIATIVPTYYVAYLDWRFIEEMNKTLVGMKFREHPEKVERITFLIHSALVFTAFFLVTILTAILIVKLTRKSKWRKTAASSAEQLNTMSNRDLKTIKMILSLSTVLIVCFVITVSISLVSFIEPEFSVDGQYYNLWMAMWSVGFMGEAINSSVNILVYYNMATKYRQTLHELFAFCIKEPVQINKPAPESENSSK